MIFLFLFLYFSLIARVDAVLCNVEPKNTEGRLRKNLFCNYDKENRPILTDGPILIKLKMIIKGFAFDDTAGKMTVSTWLGMVCVTILTYREVFTKINFVFVLIISSCSGGQTII